MPTVGDGSPTHRAGAQPVPAELLAALDGVPAGINEPPDPGVFTGEPPRRRRRRELPELGGLTITSLLDVMTIILVFLIKSFATNPVMLKQAKDLKMPLSSAKQDPPNAAAVLVTMSGIVVEDDRCIAYVAGEIPDEALSEGGMLIRDCFASLKDEVEHQKKVARLQRDGTGVFDGTLVIMVDRNVPYELVSRVMYTAGQAEFSKFRFAVVKGRGAI